MKSVREHNSLLYWRDKRV